MKRKWKRILSTGLVCTMAAGLVAGCGAGGDTKDSDKKASGDVVELRWLSSQIGESGEAEWFSNVVEGFNKEYEGKIHINVDGVAGEGVQEKIKKQMQRAARCRICFPCMRTLPDSI